MNFLFVFVCSLLVCVFFVHVFGESNNKNNNRLRVNRRESKSRSHRTHNNNSRRVKGKTSKKARKHKSTKPGGEKNLPQSLQADINKENMTEIPYEEAKSAVVPLLAKEFKSSSSRSTVEYMGGGAAFIFVVCGIFIFKKYQSLQRSISRRVNTTCTVFQGYVHSTVHGFYTTISTNVSMLHRNLLSLLRGYIPLWTPVRPHSSSHQRSYLSSLWSYLLSLWSDLWWPKTSPSKPKPSSPKPGSSPPETSPPKPSTRPPKLPCPSLPNIGSTCFFNSTLQVLLTVKDKLLTHFEQALNGCDHVIHYQKDREAQPMKLRVKFGKRPMTSAFIEFLQAVKDDQDINAKLRQLHFRIGERYSRFSSFNQQDSEEVLRCLLDGIRMEEIEACREQVRSKLQGRTDSEPENELILKDCLRATYKLKTLVDRIFGGSCVNTVICRKCVHPLQLIEPFLDLSVPMPDSNTEPIQNTEKGDVENPSECPILLQKYLEDEHKDMFTRLQMDIEPPPSDSLENCLKLFTSLDVLDEDNKFICDNCTDMLRKEKQKDGSENEDYAERLVSKQLLIHKLPSILILHMKRFHLGIRVTKNNNHIDFPDTLNVAPFCSSNLSNEPVLTYDLYGVVQHSGNLHGGHYIAYVKYVNDCEVKNEDGAEGADDGESGQQKRKDIWCYTSDSYVTLAEESEVHECQAYLLLYVHHK